LRRFRPLLPPAVLALGWAVLGAGLFASPLPKPQQPAEQTADADVSGVVASGRDGEPVPYALVKIASLERRTFADADGRFRLRRVPPGVYRVRAEQLGYATAELGVTVPRDGSAPEPVVLELEPRPIPVEGIAVSAEPVECADPGFPDPETADHAAQILDELRKNLERQRLLIERYPLQLRGEQRRQYLTLGGKVVGEHVDTIVVDLRGGSEASFYRPGSLVEVDTVRSGKVLDVKWRLRLASHSDLFRDIFQQNHCFRYVGTATVRDQVLHRIDFIPVAAIRTADVTGSLFIDGRGFVLRSATMSSVNFPEFPIGPRSFRVAITYREIYPGLLVAETVQSSIGHRNSKHEGRGFSVFVQHDRYFEYEFLGPEPGADVAGAGEER
jgi:hypothetical protein